jgi:hypothetical protein
MAYASADERASLIAGLRALAGFLEERPDVPAPRWADVMVFPPDSTDAEAQMEVATIAALIGSAVNDETASGGHCTTSRAFGPVEYRAIAIPLRTRKRSASPPNGEV